MKVSRGRELHALQIGQRHCEYFEVKLHIQLDEAKTSAPPFLPEAVATPAFQVHLCTFLLCSLYLAMNLSRASTLSACFLRILDMHGY